MKVGFRTPSVKKRVAARTSVKRAIRNKIRMPRGTAIITSPKRASYNWLYHRFTRSCSFSVFLFVVLFVGILVGSSSRGH